MAISSSHAPSSATKSACSWMHDVFLSFRGGDTRKSFTAHLYTALVQMSIQAYKDDKELERGSTIESKLWEAIENSKFSIVVFSNDYASSSWCLQELVKIVECRKTHGRTVLPVFYDVDPSDVSNQTGIYERAFVNYEQEYDMQKVKEWRDALNDVGNLSGWDLRTRDEAEVIKEIVDRIWNDVNQQLSIDEKELFGMDSRIERVKDNLVESLAVVRVIGICGMGGIGKTTLARAMYNNIYWQFEGSYFLTNVKTSFESHGKVFLQEELLKQIMKKSIQDLRDESRGETRIRKYLKNKKVLIVLDDVDDLDQLAGLIIDRSLFGSGSRVIITTRNRQVLSNFGIDGVYEADTLNKDEALGLFSRKAFKQEHPQEEFLELSKSIVAYAKGLPLALSVLGAHLCNKSVYEWESAIEKLEEVPDDKILDTLKISFDGLDNFGKQIFLDIACFLKGKDKDEAINILDGCGFYGRIGISNLIDKSLISILGNKLEMHDLLQLLGRRIVQQECPSKPGKRSRLWMRSDIFRVMESYNMVDAKTIEAICLELPQKEVVRWRTLAFVKLRRLRLLKISGVEVANGPLHLSKELRYLEWHQYPSKSLPLFFSPCNLVELDLSDSGIEELWSESTDAPNLRILNLSWCTNLLTTPDFSGTLNVERLVLRRCSNLTELHPSFQNLKKLVHADLYGCSKLVEFPAIRQEMPSLKELILDQTGFMWLPESIFNLTGLVLLSMCSCRELRMLPRNIVHLKKLKSLFLDHCDKLVKLPEDLELMESLEELSLTSPYSMEQLLIPTSIFSLKHLRKLKLQRSLEIQTICSLSGLCPITELTLISCNLGEGSVPDDIGCLSKLVKLNLSGNNFISLPGSITQLSMLQILNVNNCKMLQSLPAIPSSVVHASMSGCISLKSAPDPMKLCNIKGSVFRCYHCPELYKSNWRHRTASIMLQRYLQGYPNTRSRFDIIIPGTKIPEWFTHQCRGSSITIQTPPNFLLGRMMGVAFCVAFAIKVDGTSMLHCKIRTKTLSSDVKLLKITFSSYGRIKYRHIWACYLPLGELVKGMKVGCIDELEFGFTDFDEAIKECGVRFVSLEDVEELKNMTYLQPQLDFDDDLDTHLDTHLDTNLDSNLDMMHIPIVRQLVVFGMRDDLEDYQED